MQLKDLTDEKRKFIHSLIFPVFFTLLIWSVWIGEQFMGVDLAYLGIKPLDSSGLLGVLTSPLIHGDFFHLLDNTIPLLVLGVTVFYYYRKVAYQVFFLVYIITGFWVWLIARDAYHIGASGVIYGLAAFVFFSGVMRHDLRLLTIFLAVSFVYGSLIWGIFPIKEEISWESHLMGALSGMLISVFYRKHGPPKIVYEWQALGDDDEEDEEGSNKPGLHLQDGVYSENSTTNPVSVNYFYKEGEKDELSGNKTENIIPENPEDGNNRDKE